MDYFNYIRGELFCEDASVPKIAEEHGTPTYIYSARTILEHYRKLRDAFASAGDLTHAPLICYSVKANSSLSILKLMKDEEITRGLEKGILLCNVESEEELANIDRIAGKLGKKAPVALRVNPDVDPQTHTYISTGKKETKFGVDLERAKRILSNARELKNLSLSGLHVHIGSQITKVEPYLET